MTDEELIARASGGTVDNLAKQRARSGGKTRGEVNADTISDEEILAMASKSAPVASTPSEPNEPPPAFLKPSEPRQLKNTGADLAGQMKAESAAAGYTPRKALADGIGAIGNMATAALDGATVGGYTTARNALAKALSPEAAAAAVANEEGFANEHPDIVGAARNIGMAAPGGAPELISRGVLAAGARLAPSGVKAALAASPLAGGAVKGAAFGATVAPLTVAAEDVTTGRGVDAERLTDAVKDGAAVGGVFGGVLGRIKGAPGRVSDRIDDGIKAGDGGKASKSAREKLAERSGEDRTRMDAVLDEHPDVKKVLHGKAKNDPATAAKVLDDKINKLKGQTAKLEEEIDNRPDTGGVPEHITPEISGKSGATVRIDMSKTPKGVEPVPELPDAYAVALKAADDLEAKAIAKERKAASLPAAARGKQQAAADSARRAADVARVEADQLRMGGERSARFSEIADADAIPEHVAPETSGVSGATQRLEDPNFATRDPSADPIPRLESKKMGGVDLHGAAEKLRKRAERERRAGNLELSDHLDDTLAELTDNYGIESNGRKVIVPGVIVPASTLRTLASSAGKKASFEKRGIKPNAKASRISHDIMVGELEAALGNGPQADKMRKLNSQMSVLISARNALKERATNIAAGTTPESTARKFLKHPIDTTVDGIGNATGAIGQGIDYQVAKVADAADSIPAGAAGAVVAPDNRESDKQLAAISKAARAGNSEQVEALKKSAIDNGISSQSIDRVIKASKRK